MDIRGKPDHEQSVRRTRYGELACTPESIVRRHVSRQIPAGQPSGEAEAIRLTSLYQAGLLDTPPDPAFDRVVRLAAKMFDVPIALVSLIDSDRQWFKARVGLEAPQTPRRIAFCSHAIEQDAPMVILDATRNPRFAANPLVVGEPFIRFYAGAPLLTSDGYALGTLCVVDTTPRVLTHDQVDALRSLSHLTMTQLELGRLKRDLRTLKQSFTSRPAPR